MAFNYPTITPTSGQESAEAHKAMALPTTSANDGFDVYTFKDSSNEEETVYAVFIIRNSAAETDGSTLQVISIALSGDATTAGFTLDPLDGSSNLEMGLGMVGGNKLYADDSTFDDEQGSLYGDQDRVLILPRDVDNIDEGNLNSVNASESIANYRVVPLYKTTDITAASGATNPLNSNEYAAFLVKFKPEDFASTPNALSTLTIQTTGGTVIYTLQFTSYNEVIISMIQGIDGGAVQGTDVNVPITSQTTLLNGGTVAMGLYPVGSAASSFNKIVRIQDVSSNIGNSLHLYEQNLESASEDASSFARLWADDLVDSSLVSWSVEGGYGILSVEEDSIDLDSTKMYQRLSIDGETSGEGRMNPIQSSIINNSDFTSSLTPNAVTVRNYAQADVTQSMQKTIQFLDTQSNEYSNFNFYVTGGFYYQLTMPSAQYRNGLALTSNTYNNINSLNSQQVRNLNYSGTPNFLRKYTSHDHNALFSGDSYNLDLNFKFHNYTGPANNHGVFVPQNEMIVTSSLTENNTLSPLTCNFGGSETDTDVLDSDGVAASVSTFDMELTSPMVTKHMAVRYGVRFKLSNQSILYQNNNQGGYLHSGMDLKAVTTTEYNGLGAVAQVLQNDGTIRALISHSPEVDNVNFIHKLKGDIQFPLLFNPLPAKLHILPRNSAAGGRWEYQQTTSANETADSNYSLGSPAAGVYTNHIAIESAVTTWYKAGTATAVTNNHTNTYLNDNGSTQTNTGDTTLASLSHSWFSGVDGIRETDRFKASATVYQSNPLERTVTTSGGTSPDLFQFAPYSNILEANASFNATDNKWYQEIDVRFGNSGNYDCILHSAQIETSNMVDVSGAEAFPEDINLTWGLKGPNNTIATTSVNYFSGAEVPASMNNYRDLWTNANPATNSDGQAIGSATNDYYHSGIRGAVSLLEYGGNYSNMDSHERTGGTLRIGFEKGHTASVDGSYYAMVTVKYWKNDFHANNVYSDEQIKFIPRANFNDAELYHARFIVKISLESTAVFEMEDVDGEAISTGQSIDFGNINLG